MTQASEPHAGDPNQDIAARGAGTRLESLEHRWPQVIEASLREAASRVAPSLSTEQYDDVVHLLDHGEPGIALDLLCSHLYEDDIVVDDAVRRQIANAGNLMKMNPLLWESLAPAPWPALDAGTWWILTTGEPDDIEHLSVLRDELELEIGVDHDLYGEPVRRTRTIRGVRRGSPPVDRWSIRDRPSDVESETGAAAVARRGRVCRH